MMSGRLFIDGHDAYLTWGVYIVSDGWNEAIAYPPLKAVEFNDWQEEDGIDPDLSDPKLNTKEFSIKFAYSGHHGQLIEFIDRLSDGAYHEFDSPYIGQHFTLRMTQAPNLTLAQTLGQFAIKFSDDFPLKDYQYQPPQSGQPRSNDYLFDFVPFSDYGCRILQGTLAEVIKAPAVKSNLLRNIPSQPGAIYDEQRVTFKAKDVKLNCLMRADSLPELWRNYDALLFDLVQPEEHTLTVTDLKHFFPFHYKQSSVTRFYPSGKIWLEFSLTLTFTNSFRINDDICILTTEDGIPIFTEDEYFAIECTPKS